MTAMRRTMLSTSAGEKDNEVERLTRLVRANLRDALYLNSLGFIFCAFDATCFPVSSNLLTSPQSSPP
eukprot:5304546-Pyramimonas_sp.AAC.1